MLTWVLDFCSQKFSKIGKLLFLINSDWFNCMHIAIQCWFLLFGQTEHFCKLGPKNYPKMIIFGSFSITKVTPKVLVEFLTKIMKMSLLYSPTKCRKGIISKNWRKTSKICFSFKISILCSKIDSFWLSDKINIIKKNLRQFYSSNFFWPLLKVCLDKFCHDIVRFCLTLI